MSTEPWLTRRRLLAGIGTSGLISLSGCSRFRNNDDDTPKISTIAEIKPFPDGYTGDTERIAIISSDIQSTLGLGPNQQVRIERPGRDFEDSYLSAVYTSLIPSDDFFKEETNTIWVSESGLERIRANDGWRVSVSTDVINLDIDNRQQAKSNNEFIEQTFGQSSSYIVAAPHGGEIVSKTGKQATLVSSEGGYRSWVLSGYEESESDTLNTAADRWYIDPSNLNPASFPKLWGNYGYEPIPFDHQLAVGFLGKDNEGADVVLGGLAVSSVKETFKKAIQELPAEIDVEIATEGEYAGLDENIINTLSVNSNNGLLIYQSEDTRKQHWEAISKSVVETLQGL